MMLALGITHHLRADDAGSVGVAARAVHLADAAGIEPLDLPGAGARAVVRASGGNRIERHATLLAEDLRRSTGAVRRSPALWTRPGKRHPRCRNQESLMPRLWRTNVRRLGYCAPSSTIGFSPRGQSVPGKVSNAAVGIVVIGVGAMGRFHAESVANLKQAHLIA